MEIDKIWDNCRLVVTTTSEKVLAAKIPENRSEWFDAECIKVTANKIEERRKVIEKGTRNKIHQNREKKG